MTTIKTATQLRQEWNTKKLPDGTLGLTSYKGTDLEMEVPAMIGKTAVTAICGECFYSSNYRSTNEQCEHRKKIRSVVIPEGITTIGESAFMGCYALESITLPVTLKTIENFAFASCTALKQINIMDNMDVSANAFRKCNNLPADENGFVIFGNMLVRYCGTDAKVVIPGGTAIGFHPRIGRWGNDGAFERNKTLEHVVIPEGVTHILDSAFAYCPNLKTVEYPDSITHVHGHGFYGTPWFENHPDDVLYMGHALVKYRGKDPTLVVREGTKTISYMAFWNCNLTGAELPHGLEEIGSQAFAYSHQPKESAVCRLPQWSR